VLNDWEGSPCRPGVDKRGIDPARETVILGELGRLGGDGRLYVALPDGVEKDVTPLVTGLDHYTFDVYPTKHRLRITANWLDCQNDAFFLRPEFIVGQHVTFRGVWDKTPPALVEYLTTQKWTFGGNFYNDGTNAVPGSVFPRCSTNYFVNNGMLENDPTTAWWVSGGFPFPRLYYVNLEKGLTFENGQRVDLKESGSFQMYRPQGKISPFTTAVDVNDCRRPYLALVFGTCEGDGITFSNSISIPPGFSGSVEWMQVASSLAYSLQDAATTYVFTPTLNSDPYGDTTVPWITFDSDGAGNPVDSPNQRLGSQFIRATGSGSFQMWMMFRPNLPGEWVPLRAVNWYWNGSATNGPGGWSLESVSGDHSVNPTDFETETYPLWKSLFPYGWQFVPPLP